MKTKNRSTWKVASFLMALVMVLNLLPATAHAKERAVDDLGGAVSKTPIAKIAITYDEHVAFPSVRLTGKQVSMILFGAVTCSKEGHEVDGGWHVYGNENGISEYTALYAKSDGSNPGKWYEGYEQLYDSEEVLTTDKEYYFCFNVEPGHDELSDTETIVTVNGKAADHIVKRYNNSGADTGELCVFQKVEMNETDPIVVGISIEPSGTVSAARGKNHQFTAHVDYYGSAPTVKWSVQGAQASGTKITSAGLLKISAEETADMLTVSAKAGIFETTCQVLVTGAVPYVGDITFWDGVTTLKLGKNAEIGVNVGGDLWPTAVKFSVSGNTDPNTKFWYSSNIEISTSRDASNKLYVGTLETAEKVKVRVTSVDDPTKWAEKEITISKEGLVSGINITYDTSRIPFDEFHTEREVSLALFDAITCPKSGNEGDSLWRVYGRNDQTTEYTALFYREEGANEDNWRSGFKCVSNSEELLSADKEYYYCFNLEPYNSGLMNIRDTAITINGRPAELVRIRYDANMDTGELCAFQRIYLGETEPFEITKQPRDWYGKIGKKATFTIEATGNGLHYSWQYKKDDKWYNYNITTSDTPEFKVTMNEKNIKWPIRCVITDANGTRLKSKVVYLKDASTSQPITITSQPADFYGKIGKKALFSVKATGNGLSYQWQYKKGTGAWTNYAIATADTANFSVAMNEKNVKWLYRCLITDEDGYTITTNEVKMLLEADVPFAITAQPTDFTGTIGKKASFSVTATGAGLSYQWQYKKGTADWTDYAIATADTANFSVSMNEKNVKWLYRCRITNGSGEVLYTNEVRMKLKEEATLAITSQPGDWYGNYGQKASFNVTATGEGLSYQWQYKKGTTWSDYAIATADTANFKVTMNEKNVKWTFRCVITDAKGNTITTNEVKMVLAE